MDKKKVIIIGPAHPLRGGLASFNERLARAFKEQGNEAIIYTFTLQYPGILFPGTTQYSSEPAPTDLKIIPVINSVNPLNWITTGRKLKKENADLIVVRYWLPFMGPALGTILRITRKNKHTRIVCIADNIIPHEKRLGDTLFTKYFIRPIHGFVTMSAHVMTDLRRFTSKPATLVQHPLYDNFGPAIAQEAARDKLKLDKHQRILLFFGFIRKYKGLDLLLEAMHLLKIHAQNNPEFGMPALLIAGEFYEDAQPYKNLIEKYNLEDNVYAHTHFIPDSEVVNYLCAADVVVQPYRNATQSGVTPLAYHFEIPMIVTNVGALPDFVPHLKCGLVTQPNPQAIADSIIQFFTLNRLQLIEGVKEEKKKYSWQIMTEALWSVSKEKKT